jgi:leucyl aminopeptidase
VNPNVRVEGVAGLEIADGADAWVIVGPAPLREAVAGLKLPERARQALALAFAADRSLAEKVTLPVVIPLDGAPGRMVLAPTAAPEHETQDVRLFAEATAAAVVRAIAAGASRPVLQIIAPTGERFSRTLEVCALAAAGAAWEPLEAREARGEGWACALQSVRVVGLSVGSAVGVNAIEAGRWLCRDLATGGPERLTPLRFAAACEQVFASTAVRVSVQKDVSGYPLLQAVSRAAATVERHRPCVLELDLQPPGPIERTLLLAGKGVTYDTGGADVKTDGGMAGMSRDKGGAAVVAGLVRALALNPVPGLRVLALVGLVRNSIGEESFVSDEILSSRAGVRVRVGNTDAEGRLVLADLLCALRERSTQCRGPVLASVATLTGHVYRAFGPYVGALENDAARRQGVLEGLKEAGELWGEPFESTRPRREDYLLVAPKAITEDVLSSNRLATVDTPRGHQGPYAFLDVASGLKGSGLPFVHLDLSGVVVSPPDWQAGRPTGSPIAAWMAALRPCA